MNAFADIDFPIEVVRTNRRKTISVNVENGLVKVSAPNRLSDTRISELLHKKNKWIKDKILIQSQTPTANEKEYISGECFSYLGKNYRLKVVSGGEACVKLKGGFLTVGISEGLTEKQKQSDVQEQLVTWYMNLALKRLREKTKRYSKLLNLNPRSINIKKYKSRWGSCSPSNDITYNWKIIIAPHHIIDYVVVHELCHMKEHNHSPKFWKLVERIIPDHKESRQWLKHNGWMLEV